MAEPHWTSYVAIVTGLIGAVTGIAGAIVAYISYRKINKLKALDLRLELRKAVSDVHTDLDRLMSLIRDADRSKRNTLAARGMSRSGEMVGWENAVKADTIKIQELRNRAPKAESTYDAHGVKDLESELIAVHKLQTELRGLLDEYHEAIRSDDEQRKQIHEDQRARDTPRT